MRKIEMLFTMMVALVLTGCFGLRSGSNPQQTEIAFGKTVGAPTEAARVMTALAVTPGGTETPESNLGTQVSEFLGIPTRTPTPSPTPIGTPLFRVLTAGSGEWTPIDLFIEPGVQPTGARWVVQVTHDVSLSVHDSASEGKYLQVKVEGWMELSDLESAGAMQVDQTICTEHDWGHSDLKSQCHAHLYQDYSQQQKIAVVQPGVEVRVVEVNTNTRMAKVIVLPLLWIDCIYTQYNPGRECP